MTHKPHALSKSTRDRADKGARLLKISDVAELDNVSEKTVRRAIDADQLKAIRVGPGRRLLRIHPEDHAAYRRTQGR